MRVTQQPDETSAQKSDDLFRLLVDAVTEYAIFALDAEGNVLTWNQGAHRLKGYAAAEVIGTHFSRFYTQADIDRRHPCHELDLATRHGKYEEEGWRVRKDGTTFWATVVITALRDERGALRGFGKVTRDLTERKKAEEALREAYADLERRIAARTEELSNAKGHAEDAVKSRDEFISMASHELKTPLTALKLQTQLRQRRVAKGDYTSFAPEKLAGLWQNDDRQLQRLTDLVDRMLDISRISSGHFELSKEAFDLGDFLRDLVARLSPSLQESGNEISFDTPGPVVGAWDRLRLEQAFSNLILNAGKYAPGTPIEVHARVEGAMTVVSIRDHGKGISPENQAKIFEPFERLKQRGGVGGLGLGLYITRQIVDAHEGSIRVESEPGVSPNSGCTFVVELPLNTLD